MCKITFEQKQNLKNGKKRRREEYRVGRGKLEQKDGEGEKERGEKNR